jgi:FMN phosphatase YigB (HAD superfamily)
MRARLESRLKPLLHQKRGFSNEARFLKPQWEIYRRGCTLLGIEPARATFVGDGARDEIRAVLAELIGSWVGWFLEQWPQHLR